MSRILLCGAFGQSNPGDDALLTSFTKALADHQLVVPVAGQPNHGRAVDHLRAVDASVSQIPATARAVAGVLSEVDGVVVAGGTLFKLLHPTTRRHPLALLARTAALQAGARVRGIPFALVGVGAAELRGSTARWLSRHIADHADVLVLRDEESATVLHDVGATGPFRVAADPAWSLLGQLPAPSDGRSQRDPGPEPVLVAISHHADHDTSRLTECMVTLVDHLTAQGIPVQLQPWQGGPGDADAQLADAVRQRAWLPHLVGHRDRPTDLLDAVATCAEARAVIGFRFHSLVAAAAADRAFLAVAHEPKLAGLARRLGQVSIPPHAAPVVLSEAADLALRTAPAHRTLVEGQMDLARHSLRLLRVVLSRGAEDDLVDEGRTELTEGIPW